MSRSLTLRRDLPRNRWKFHPKTKDQVKWVLFQGNGKIDKEHTG